MTAEATSTSGARRVVLPLLAAVAVGLLLRWKFVDLLTKTTGTWIGGVESPHRATDPVTDPTPAPAAEPSAG